MRLFKKNQIQNNEKKNLDKIDIVLRSPAYSLEEYNLLSLASYIVAEYEGKKRRALITGIHIGLGAGKNPLETVPYADYTVEFD